MRRQYALRLPNTLDDEVVRDKVLYGNIFTHRFDDAHELTGRLHDHARHEKVS